jgi:hypothetical protein
MGAKLARTLVKHFSVPAVRVVASRTGPSYYGASRSSAASPPRMLRIGFTARDLRDFGSAYLHYELDAPDMKIYVRRRKDKGHG